MLKQMGAFFFCGFFYFSLASAEVKEVVLQWTPGLCTETCVKNLNGELNKIKGVSQVKINQGQAQAVLTYKSGAPFAFEPIMVSMQMIGLWMEDIQVTVKGTIKHTAQDVYLISSGDFTRFTLLGPAQAPAGVQSQNVYIEQYSPYNRALPENVRQQLLTAEQNKQEVTVKGPLLQPERGPPLILIVHNITK